MEPMQIKLEEEQKPILVNNAKESIIRAPVVRMDLQKPSETVSIKKEESSTESIANKVEKEKPSSPPKLSWMQGAALLPQENGSDQNLKKEDSETQSYKPTWLGSATQVEKKFQLNIFKVYFNRPMPLPPGCLPVLVLLHLVIYLNPTLDFQREKIDGKLLLKLYFV
jgi:hypothetical protein